MPRTSHLRALLPLCVPLVMLACSDPALPITPEEAALDHAGHEVAASTSPPRDYIKQLRAVRRATAPFHRFDKATAAGWDHQFTPCIMNPTGTAGMGFHYTNPDLMDRELDVETPEALLYEPDASGTLRLVAVEYLVPFSVHPADAAPPELFGLQFSRSMAFGVWGLHAWVWRHNPDGVHAPFNPSVNCDNA